MSDRKFITVLDHPAFAPHTLPLAPRLTLPNGVIAPMLAEALCLPPKELTRWPTGYLNVLCATMLPDTADLDIRLCMKTLGEWVQFVRQETDRQFHKFRRRPDDFQNSEAYYRVLVMITALQRDPGVRYDPECIKRREFASSREGFLHGLLTGNRTGTCANMPVLYVAVGRALGYPLYLVLAKGHLFCRWHSLRTNERFNVEASGQGLTTPTDDHYKNWPRPMTDNDVYHGVYLRNLDPMEELGHFMATRGHYLRDKGHLLDAIVAYSHAHRLCPTDPTCMSFLLTALNNEIDQRRDGKIPSTYRQTEKFTDHLPLARYVIDDRHSARVCGVNLIDAKTGRLIADD